MALSSVGFCSTRWGSAPGRSGSVQGYSLGEERNNAGAAGATVLRSERIAARYRTTRNGR
jgi:hypothetical protein